MIRISDVGYRYPDGDQPCLRDITEEIEEGAFTVIAGRSGSGKSTFLRTINGLIPHFYGGRFTGSVTVDGHSTLDSLPRFLADKVGFVGQDPEDHSVVDKVEAEIAFTLESLGIDEGISRKRVEEVLDALAIAPLRGRLIETLSGGERQRVAIASALAAMPRYLVLDEPTSQLDPQSSDEVVSAILRLRDEFGIGIVLAEQRLERVIQYADRLWMIDAGRVRSGDTRDLLSHLSADLPIVRIGNVLGWHPLPMTLREARAKAKSTLIPELDRPAHAITGETVLAMAGTSVDFSGRRVLHNINLEVSQGEIVAVMGRNGSGKTTLLRAAAGLLAKTGKSISRKTAPAFVPQHPKRILFRDSVRREIAATLRARRLAHDEAAVMKVADQFRLTDLLDRFPLDLSGGERTRAAIAACCAGAHDLLLLDEPTRGMDMAAKRDLIEYLKTAAASGAGVIVATHDVELAAAIASRVILLAEGEVVVDAPPASALSGSMTFSTQVNKIFGRSDLLTADDVLEALRP